MCIKLKNIEKRIVEIQKQISQTYETAYKRFPVKDHADMAAEGGKTKLLRNELEELETKRRFLLDRRESWLPKTIWNVVIPIAISIIVTILTLYITNRFGINKGLK
jgi:hypothetical protein